MGWVLLASGKRLRRCPSAILSTSLRLSLGPVPLLLFSSVHSFAAHLSPPEGVDLRQSEKYSLQACAFAGTTTEHRTRWVALTRSSSSMSAAVRAALAARRAAAKLSSSKPTDDDILVQPFGTPKKNREDSAVGQTTTGLDEPLETSDLWISQRGEGELLFKSCWTGKLNLSSRQPAFRTLPLSLFTLLDADAPQWYEDGSEKVGERRAWYERQDLQTLAVANGDLEEIDARLAEFASLVRLDVSLYAPLSSEERAWLRSLLFVPPASFTTIA